jgi:hypothetical protein
MSKEKAKTTPTEAAAAWIKKHGAEGVDLKGLNAAVAAVERKTAEAQAAANKLGEILEARKAALKALKDALKAAKADRKSPQAAKPAVPKGTPAPKKAAPKKASAPKPDKPA